PKLLARLEENLERKDLNDIAAAFWPLPVYRPRLRVWPQDVSTDEDGLSLAMGLTAAAVDPRSAPRAPRVLEPAGPPLSELPRGRGLEVGLAPDVLHPLTDLLIDADVARIHVRDIPEKRFAALADRAALADAVPELRRYGDSAEIWAELVLTNPLSMLDSPPLPEVETAAKDSPTTTSGNSNAAVADSAQANEKLSAEKTPEPPPSDSRRALRISAPKVAVSLAIRPDPQAKWTPFAQIDFSVAQEAVALVEVPNFRTRTLLFEWKGEPIVEATARFAPDYKPQDSTIDVQKIRGLFLDAWRGWTQTGPLAEAPVNDIDFGFTKLRLKNAEWTGHHLMLSFAEPGIKITNNSDVELVYETKAPETRWGGPYTLAPGKSHDYPVAYPLLYRQKQNGQYRTFTLPAGMDFEFRSAVAGTPPGLFQARENASAAPAATEPSRESS
ncbi:MAG: hypothetical protein WD648_13990, partial [Planctomycetaceae bacterium]